MGILWIYILKILKFGPYETIKNDFRIKSVAYCF